VVSSKHGARISVRDLQEIDSASNRLAAVAAQVKRANPAWAPAVIELLIEANDVILRIQAKGAGTFARYLEKRGLQSTQDAPETAAAAGIPASSPDATPGEEET